MAKRVELPVVGETPKTLGRREVLGLMGAAGASAWPCPPLPRTIPSAITWLTHDRVAAADTRASVPGAKPVFLDAHQMATLVALAERIVPGSTRAKVAPFVDQLLAVDTPDEPAKVPGRAGLDRRRGPGPLPPSLEGADRGPADRSSSPPSPPRSSRSRRTSGCAGKP